jgi:hypothetical protein
MSRSTSPPRAPDDTAGWGQEIIAKGFVLLLAGVAIYIGMKWQQRDGGRTAVALTLPAEGEGAGDAPERGPVPTAAGNGRREA